MKKTTKNLILLLLNLTIVFSVCIPAFAVGTVSKPKAQASYSSVTLSWDKVTGADGYEVSVLSGKDWKIITSTSATEYTHTKLKINTTYRYRIRAYDKRLFAATQYGEYSPTVSAKTALAKVTGVKVSSATATGFKLSWNKTAGATGYQVYVYSSGKWVYKKKAASNSVTFSGAKLGKTYQYRIRAYRTVGKTSYYGPFSSTVKAKCVLQAPSSVKLSAVGKTSATLTWKTADKASGCQVYLKSGSDWIRKTSSAKEKYTLKNLKPGTRYSVRLRTYKKVGNSYFYSAYTAFSFKTTADLSSAPTSLSQICDRYNEVVNNAKKERNVTIRKRSTVSLTCTDCSVGALVDSVNKMLKSMLTPTDTTVTVKDGKASDQNGNDVDLNGYIVPCGRFAALKKAYVADAQVTAVPDGYTMKITLKEEISTFDGIQSVSAKGHESCLDPLNLALLDLPAGVAVTEAEMIYPGATLITYIGSSGKLKKLTVTLPLEGRGTGRLQSVSLTVGLEGTMKDIYDFSY